MRQLGILIIGDKFRDKQFSSMQCVAPNERGTAAQELDILGPVELAVVYMSETAIVRRSVLVESRACIVDDMVTFTKRGVRKDYEMFVWLDFGNRPVHRTDRFDRQRLTGDPLE